MVSSHNIRLKRSLNIMKKNKLNFNNDMQPKQVSFQTRHYQNAPQRSLGGRYQVENPTRTTSLTLAPCFRALNIERINAKSKSFMIN